MMKTNKIIISVLLAILTVLSASVFVACETSDTVWTVTFVTESAQTTAEFKDGETVKFPVVSKKPGFVAQWCEGETVWTESSKVTKNVTLTLRYVPATEAEYIVRHMLENATDSGWTENYSDRETLIGDVNALSAATAKTYEGFTAQEITQKTVAADGSTMVDVYYVRKVFEVTFKNTDGTVLATYDVKYGGRPVYSGKTPKCPVDTPVNLTFAGWTEELAPVTGNATYIARYTAVEEGNDGNVLGGNN